MNHGFLEEILGADRGHLRPAAFPLGFYEDFTLDVIVLLYLFLLLNLLLFPLLLRFLGGRKFTIWLLSNVPLAGFTLLESHSAEGNLLDEGA